MRNKSGVFNFVWLFAIIAGAAILVLAVYGAMKAGDVQRFQTDSEIAKSISVLMDPLQSGFAEGSHGKISFTQETRINNDCSFVDFGSNDVSVSTRSGVGEAWVPAGVASSMPNKYVFSGERNSGKDFYVFSKSFEFPYKVADLIFMTTGKYCFLGAPEDLVDDVVAMRVPNIEVENCSYDAVKVCFGYGNDCNITVVGTSSSYEVGTVEKDGESLIYVGDFMYGAIFADEDIYECNVRRLMYRTGMIADVYLEKADLMDARGCNTNLQGKLAAWKGMVDGADSGDLGPLRTAARGLGRDEDGEACGLW